MGKINTVKKKGIYLRYLVLVISATIFVAGCEKTDGPLKLSEVNFSLEGGSEDVHAPVLGTNETFKIKADGLWIAKVIDGGDWVKIAPTEGNGDGEIAITVAKNRTDKSRAATITFTAGFERQGDLIRIEQDLNPDPPYFTIDGNPEGYSMSGHSSTQEFTVHSNTTWKVDKTGEGADWLEVTPDSGEGDGTFTISVESNPDYISRSASLSFTVDGLKQTNLFKVTQDGKVDNSLILNENFDWLNYGSAIFYTTTGETRIDSWSPEQIAMGWTSTLSPVSGDQPLYARQGFVKIGKTNYGGDLISPKLSEVDGTQDLTVSFKAVPYMTKAGAQDGTLLRINIIGPGTASPSQFNISNWPVYAANRTDGKTEEEVCAEIWDADGTTRNFTITGATSETQIQFLGDGFDLRDVPPNKNRIFLDDIIVTVKK